MDPVVAGLSTPGLICKLGARLFMSPPPPRPSVSALLILAGDESNDKSFPTELMAQVKALRDELDSEKLRLAEQTPLGRRFGSESKGDCLLLSKTLF